MPRPEERKMKNTNGLRAWLCLLLVASVFLGGCASFYVDGNSPEVAASEFKKPATPGPVQLIWEFQTKGVANARATEYLKPKVREQIAASGLFTSVLETPAPDGALLVLRINNIPLTEDAVSKGFITGLTFGLAGQTVADGYECSLRFTPGGQGAQPVEKQAKHVLYTGLGTGGPPPGALKMASGEEAISTVLRQVLSRLLNQVSRDASFQ
jgi:hypothetical protein